jgi:hypothetical protein
MIRKSAKRFSERIMHNQPAKARWRFNLILSRFKCRRRQTHHAGARVAKTTMPGAGDGGVFAGEPADRVRL